MPYIVMRPEKAAPGDTEGAEILVRIASFARAVEVGSALRRGLYCVVASSARGSAQDAAGKLDAGHLVIEVGGVTWVRQAGGVAALAVDVPDVRGLPVAGGGRYGDYDPDAADHVRPEEVAPEAVMELFQRIRVDARLAVLLRPEDTLSRRTIVAGITKEVAADRGEDPRALASALAMLVSRHDKDDGLSMAP